MPPLWRGVQPPSRSSSPVYDTVWPQVGSPVEGTALAHQFTGVPIHWEGERRKGTRRSVVCPGPGQCGRCDPLNIPLDWRGYLPIYSAARGRVQVLVLGWHAYSQVERLLSDGRSLYGTMLHLSRSGPSNYGPIVARLSAGDAKSWRGPLPDLTATLVAICGEEVRPYIGQPPAIDQAAPKVDPAPAPGERPLDAFRRARANGDS